MSMRKYLRGIAKANMERAGIKGANKQQSIVKLPNGKLERVNQSKFSREWTKYID